MINNNIIDIEQAMALVQGDLSLLRELAETFYKMYPTYLAEIDSAIKEQNSQKLEKSAHKFKGALKNFAALESVDIVFNLERIGRENSLSEASEEYQKLEQAVERFRQTLSSLVQNV